MTRSWILLRTFQHSLKLCCSSRLPLLSVCSHQPYYCQNSVAVCSFGKHFHSSRNVSELEKIYEGPASKHIFMLKLMSLTTSVTAVVLEAALFYSDASIAAKIGWSFAAGFTFITPFLSHIIFRKYVIEMYYDAANDSYTAAIYTILATKKYITFTVKDVESLGIEIISTVRIKGRPLFFDSKYFTDVNHYKKLLGYDKPIDFGIEEKSIQEDLENLMKSKEKTSKSQS